MRDLLYFVTVLSLFLFAVLAKAAVISPSATEVDVKFQAEFYTERYSAGNEYELISEHYQHLFGYFTSPTIVRHYRVNYNLIAGIGAPQMPMNVTAKPIITKSGAGHLVNYKVSGKMLLQNKVAQSVLIAKSWTLTLPYELDTFYDESCTDEHYNSIGDFWYFYDPFRKGCEYLQKSPVASFVTLNFSASRSKIQDASARLDLLRGDNGNGEVFQITTMNGFAEDSKSSTDEGRESFQNINRWLIKKGFTEKILNHSSNRPVHQYEKEVTGQNGKSMTIRVIRLLAETSVASKNVTFAKVFKRAIEESDILIYAGHSGLGGNLDIPSLEEKAGKISFSANKRQIFYFNGCSTYSYYLAPFAEQKSKSKLDIITNGLSSLFITEFNETSRFMEILFDLDKNPSWMEVLKSMESTLDGRSYLLNVGAI